MKTFKHKNITFEYEIIGEGKPFVFLHGLGGSVDQIKTAYDMIDGVQLITMNQQGHGDSGINTDTLSFDSLGDDVIALLDELGIQRATLGGISMGAAVSLNVGVRYPSRVESLILIRNAWIDGPMMPDRIQAYKDMADCLDAGGEEAFKKTRGYEAACTSSEYTKNTFLNPFRAKDKVRHTDKFRIIPKSQPICSANDLSALKFPVSIIACRNDFCHPFEYSEWLRDRIAGAVFTEIPSKDADGAGHRMEMNNAIKRHMQL